MIHLVDQILTLGPLYLHSMFSYEPFLAVLKVVLCKVTQLRVVLCKVTQLKILTSDPHIRPAICGIVLT
jgi:hypothetical protein